MPVDFLTAEQRARYGRYGEDPTPEQLARCFHLTNDDRELVDKGQSDRVRLGCAVQLGTVRFLGTFLADQTDVPTVVVDHLATQLGISDPSALKGYNESAMRFKHTTAIRERFGYRDFNDQPWHLSFVRWLYTRAYLGGERHIVLFDLSTVRMVEAKVLLPAASTLERLIASVKERAAIQLWRALGAIPDEETKERLLTLLAVPPGRRRQSALDRLRKAPTSPSINGLVGALRRLEEIETLGAGRFDLGRIPQGRLDAMARHVAKAKAAEIERMPAERRMAHLVAYTATLEGNAIDDVLTILDDVVGGLLSKVERKGKRRRLRTLGDLDRAALALREAWFELKAAAEDPEADLRATVMRLAVEHVDQAAATVAELARPPDDRYFEDLPSRYSHVRRFLPHLLRLVTFEGTDAAKPVLAAWNFLRRQEVERPKPRWVDAPLEVASGVWRPIVEPKPGQIDHRAYTLCALERLRDAMRKRDVFVKASRRWRDPREQLLAGDEWETARSGVCRSLGRSADGEAELALLAEELDLAWRRTAEDLPTNTALAIEERYGRAYVRLTPLEAAPQPASFVALEKAVAALMPKVDLPDVILEVASWTGFPDEFTHVSEGEARVDDLWITVCAVLLAEACNVGLEPLARKKVPALTRSRLAFVAQNYFRAETETRANTRFVNFQATMALARQWGGGDVASVDGLRFIVPVRTINAGPNPHYFHYGAGVTLYSFVSNQFTGFHHMVIPGTDRDSFYILGGPIDNVTSLSPVQFISDTAGSSEIIYGLFWLMGFLYSPREADLNEARFWRLDRNADYGVLNDLARNRANGKVIVDNWDDLIRVAGSLKTGKVQPMDLIRSLRSGSRLTSLGAALAELGRLPKTLHNLAFIAKDETYRRGILTALNHGESRNKLARRVFHGQKGELRQRYREGQEDQLGALGLVVNIIVLWNTRYMEAALDHLRATGFDVREDDVRRLTPLIWEHIELHGRYAFRKTSYQPARSGPSGTRPCPTSPICDPIPIFVPLLLASRVPRRPVTAARGAEGSHLGVLGGAQLRHRHRGPHVVPPTIPKDRPAPPAHCRVLSAARAPAGKPEQCP